MADNQQEEADKIRSNFVRQLIQRPNISLFPSLTLKNTPKRIVQFWDNLDRLPRDVSQCMETWRNLEDQGFKRLLFDKHKAGQFIYRKFGLRHKQAYDKCYHPAMQSDFFRLCYILIEGGCYIDADDVYQGPEMHHLFIDGRLKIQPLCYDAETHVMVPPRTFAKDGENATSWIFYFNNNPLIASTGHPIIQLALAQAVLYLEKDLTKSLPEIQSTTGPGNLTESIFNAISKDEKLEQTILILSNWEDTVANKWDLGYRNDSRNWRLSNGQYYIERNNNDI